jgi:hypothetical protein
MIRGYPGKFEGDPYYATGHIKNHNDNFLCYDFITYTGNSGSPIIAILPFDSPHAFKYKSYFGPKILYEKLGGYPFVIGVHTGSN